MRFCEDLGLTYIHMNPKVGYIPLEILQGKLRWGFVKT